MDSNLTFSIVSAVLKRRKEYLEALVYEQLVDYAVQGTPPHTQKTRAEALGLGAATFRAAEERLVDWGVLLPPKGKYKARELVLAGVPTPRFIVRVVSGLYPELAMLRAVTKLPPEQLDYRAYGVYHFDTPLPGGYAEAFVSVIRGLFEAEQILEAQVGIELEAPEYLPELLLQVDALFCSSTALTTTTTTTTRIYGDQLAARLKTHENQGEVEAVQGLMQIPPAAIGEPKRTVPLKPCQHSWQYKTAHTAANIQVLEPENWAAAERITAEWNRVTKQRLRLIPGLFALIRELLVESEMPEEEILEAIRLYGQDEFFRRRPDIRNLLDGTKIQTLLSRGAKHDRHARGLAGEAPTETREF